MAALNRDPQCIFCRILAGQAPAEILYQDDLVTVFPDRLPRARVHLLVIPNEHIGSMNEASAEHSQLLGRLLLVAKEMAREKGLDKKGYRLVANTGPDAGQSVPHLHFHILGGQRLLPGFLTW